MQEQWATTMGGIPETLLQFALGVTVPHPAGMHTISRCSTACRAEHDNLGAALEQAQARTVQVPP